MIRIVVAEDSPAVRRHIVAMFAGDVEMRVVGEATNGAEAIEMAERLAPDVITMDVQMPGIDGLEATREIMSRIPTPILIVSALASDREAGLTFEATRAGALTVLPMPTEPGSPHYVRQREQFVATVKAMSRVKVVRRRRDTTAGSPSTAAPPTPASVPAYRGGAVARLVAIACSTGGPPALRDILVALPPGFPVPILIAQHIARGFVGALAQWLGTECRLPVHVAASGQEALPGAVYLAPDDHHLGVRTPIGPRVVLELSSAPAVGGFRPSGTHLFESAAAAAGAGVVAVILTGMGSDGVAGLRAVHARGGRVLAQDEATSVIYGMPREAVLAGVVDASVALPDIPARLVALVGSR